MTTQECNKEVTLAKQALASLRDSYGLQIGDVETTEVGTTQMIAKSHCTAVRISCSPRDGIGLDVVVGRLTDGKFPTHPGTIDGDTILNRFDLRDLASVRVDQLETPLRRKIEKDARLNPEDIVTLIERCCGEVLQGNFSTFDDASVVVKKRAKRLSEEYPTTSD